MKTTLHHPKLYGSIDAIPSKSHAHRLLIAAAFADCPTEIRCRTVNRDICATMDCLNALGADIREAEAGVYRIRPVSGDITGKRTVLDVGESGSTLRFLLPVALAAGADASFVCHGRLPERPLSPLYEQLVLHGASLSPKGTNPFMAHGKISGGTYELDGGVSSQFVTGLLLALPLTGEDASIRLTGKIESRPYIDITLRTLQNFQIQVTERDGVFVLPAQRYLSPGKLDVEGDWSNAAFFLVAGAFSDEGMTVRKLQMDSPQGDRTIVSLLSAFGAEVEIGEDCVTVKRNKLHAPAVPVDASDIPDLIPIVAVLASVAEGTTVIENCGRLRLKESDRLATIAGTLTTLGADASILDDSLVIRGVEQLTGGTVSSCNDHRIAMAAAIASMVSTGEVTIEQSEAVAKSYPMFFEDFYKNVHP
ncbi:MAG: 3-phosphoshikimate 1-carboxyvinyltransferase [Eubacteriales bacterium]